MYIYSKPFLDKSEVSVLVKYPHEGQTTSIDHSAPLGYCSHLTLMFTGNGTVEFSEFENFMLTSGVLNKIPDEMDENLRDAFQILDKNNDGFIDKEELIFYMTKFGKHCVSFLEINHRRHFSTICFHLILFSVVRNADVS